MQSSVSPIVFFAALTGILALVAIAVGVRTRPAKMSGLGLAAALLPALLMLVLFYSLAFHMHRSLGSWPNSIGERGFPAALIAHGSVALHYFGGLLLTSIFAWPVAFVVCALSPKWRIYVYYLGMYALACLVCFGAMLLAPAQFLNWWWD